MRALFLDLDHTLIRPLEGRTFPKDKLDWEFLPNVLAHVAMHLNRGEKIIIVSNQGGIEAGFHTKRDIEDKLQNVISDMMWNIKFHDHELYRSQTASYYCPTNDKAHPDRKPNPGMILRAAKDHHIDLANSLFVGDMQTDRQAAEAAGVPFVHIDDFLASEDYVR